MSALALKEIESPSLAPEEAAIDLDHLSRMTLGERSLETAFGHHVVHRQDALTVQYEPHVQQREHDE